ncbi:MAG TPA: hypothetical protein VFJ91_03085 [Gaiellaceae bacterium]|nr:hypothetical protein [Gaiellaceae bacterium]
MELLGDVHGSGYRDGASLVRRADGQVVQLGPLMYALLDAADGTKTNAELAAELSDRLGRRCEDVHVARLAEKLAAQGLLAGSEANAPPRRNPLLALRWKVLVTRPRSTRLLTAPFTPLFHPVVVWPVLASFLVVCWFVLFRKGIGSATAQAFDHPALLLLVFALTVASAGFHELGHAAACRYGGATPGGIGMGIYLVWPAFYTDVTDAYRLPRGDRLRVDLGGIYFNAVVAVATAAAWLAWRVDALFLLVALQLLMIVKNLSPVIRSDGYHILSDLTGVPDLYAHVGPTLKRLLPWRRREPSALTGKARALVTIWVLAVVPVLLSLLAGAVLLLPRLLASTWDSGQRIAGAIPHEGTTGVLASLLRLLALALPVLGSALVTQRVARTALDRAVAWTSGRSVPRAALSVASALCVVGIAWAWWPSGQYRPVTASASGTLTDLTRMLGSPGEAVRPAPVAFHFRLAPGRHLAVAMVPRGGPTKRHPAFYFVPGGGGDPPATLVDDGSGLRRTVAFPFSLPKAPGPGDTQALAVNTTDGGVVYDVAYAIVTVDGDAPVANRNGAYAYASCRACTTVAVSFQLVLVVGTSHSIAPVDLAGALNSDCPACETTAIADQLVVTLTREPPAELVQRLQAALRRLDAISLLGKDGTPDAVAAQVDAVRQQVAQILADSGLVATRAGTTTAQTSTAATTTSTTTTTQQTTTAPAAATEQTTTAGTTTSAATTTGETTTAETTTTEPATSTESTTTATTTAGTTTTPPATTTTP